MCSCFLLTLVRPSWKTFPKPESLVCLGDAGTHPFCVNAPLLERVTMLVLERYVCEACWKAADVHFFALIFPATWRKFQECLLILGDLAAHIIMIIKIIIQNTLIYHFGIVFSAAVASLFGSLMLVSLDLLNFHELSNTKEHIPSPASWRLGDRSRRVLACQGWVAVWPPCLVSFLAVCWLKVYQVAKG